MLYTMEQDRVEQRIIKQCMQDRSPLPKRIANAPRLQLGLELYYGSFWDLDSSRPLGFDGDGPIRWIDIHEYCIAMELGEEQVEDMHHHIRMMDNAYLKRKHEKSGGNS